TGAACRGPSRVDRPRPAGVAPPSGSGPPAPPGVRGGRPEGVVGGGRRVPRRNADAVEPALAARLVLARTQRLVVGKPHQLVERGRIVAGIEDRSGRTPVGKRIFWHEIAPAQFSGVDSEAA